MRPLATRKAAIKKMARGNYRVETVIEHDDGVSVDFHPFSNKWKAEGFARRFLMHTRKEK